MNKSVGKNKAAAKVKAKAVRKPLGDLTNTLRPRALEKPSKKKKSVKNYDWVKEEGFLHDHKKCIECANVQRNATMIIDIFPECNPATESPTKLVEFEFETPVKLAEFEIDLYPSPTSFFPSPRLPTPKTPGSPCLDIDPFWITAWDNNFPLKLKLEEDL